MYCDKRGGRGMRRFRVGGVALLLGMVVTLAGACGEVIGEPGARTATTQAAPAYAAKLETTLQAIIKDLSVPGAVVMITSPERGDWTKAFGTRTVKGGGPVTVDDHFRIGSNTKTMTGTVIL